MNEIERAKHDGAVDALSRRLDSLRFELINLNWTAIKNNARFCRLGHAIDNAENILRQMRETLTALQDLEPKNK